MLYIKECNPINNISIFLDIMDIRLNDIAENKNQHLLTTSSNEIGTICNSNEPSTSNEVESASKDCETFTVNLQPSLNVDPSAYKNNRVLLYAEDKGPKLYPVRGNIVTPVLITKNLPQAFRFMPIHGKPNSKKELDNFHQAKIREFVGCDLNDEEFHDLAALCRYFRITFVYIIVPYFLSLSYYIKFILKCICNACYNI